MDRFYDRLGPDYERRTPKSERRRKGQYYTPEWLADLVLDAAGYSGRGTLVDPACGSGVFLLRALRRAVGAPELTGYDSDPVAVELARAQMGGSVEIRDTICDPGEQRFDFVVGNPPWVNWRNLDVAARTRLAPLWDRYGLFPHRGLQARLGAGMDDLSALATYVWADRLAVEEGTIALVLPQRLLQSAGGGAGFRRFELPGGRFLRVLSVRDFDSRQCFAGAATRAAIVVMTVSRRATVYPVPYLRGETACDAVPVSSERGAPWAIVRRGLAESLERMRGASPYRARVGIHSGGAAGIYWVDVLERADGLVRVANRSDAGRQQVEAVEAWVEGPLVRRLLRGRDVKRRAAEPSAHILLPYNDGAKAIGEAELAEQYPLAFGYFQGFRTKLQNRAHYRRHFTANDPPWSLYNTGAYSFARHRVVWREQASTLCAAIVSDPGTVADAKLTLVACQSREEAGYLEAVLNSSAARAFVESYAVKTQISTHVLRYMAVPQFRPDDPLHRAIAEQGAGELVCKLWGTDPGVFAAAD
jgi:hypothetical protein